LATFWSNNDPSLVPSLYRHIDKYSAKLSSFRDLILEMGDWLNRGSEILPPAYDIRVPGSQAENPFPTIPDMGWSTHWQIGTGNERIEFTRDWHLGGAQLQRGILLQHYGFPTPWLDITRSPDVAVWFAVNRCRSNAGRLSFSGHSWGGEDPRQWPTVFVFALVADAHPMVASDKLLSGSSALRPQRQQCGLLGAAGNLARNYPARYVALRIRLHPLFHPRTNLTAEYLFPGPEIDGTLKLLLELTRPPEFPQIFPITRLDNKP
jgi:hypothetical protein